MKDILLFKNQIKYSDSTNMDLGLSVKINCFKHSVPYVRNTKHTVSIPSDLLTSNS